MNAVNEHIFAEHTVYAWCLGMSESVKNRDLTAHMAHVSRRVRVYGIPGKDAIDFRTWQGKRKFEFDNDELLALNYQQIRLISSTQRRLRFNAKETTVGKSGKVLQVNKNIILEVETDNVWRVVEETVNDWKLKQIDLSKY